MNPKNSIIPNFQTKIKNFLKKFVTLTSIGLFLVSASSVNAASYSQLNKIDAQLDAARKNLNSLHQQSSSLKTEIARFDARITTIELEIQATQERINVTNQEIAETNIQIIETEKKISEQRKVLNEFLKEMYLNGQVSLAEQIISSESFSDFVDQNEYLNTMQSKVKETVDKIVALKKDLDKRKADLENKKKQIENLKKEQLAKKADIAAQRAAKQQLLANVGANEAKYQKLMGSLQAQYDAVQNELARIAASASTSRGIFGGGYKSYGHVNKGDIIGYQGNSGYSTGTHLHFELRIGGADRNPWTYVQNGTFTNPLPGSHVTQYWGETGNLAGYYRHTGMDLSAYYGAPVRAAASGEIIARTTGWGNTYPGQVSYGNYVMIRHANGFVTIYGHLR